MSIPVQCGVNQGVWSQNGDTMSPGLGSTFWLMKKAFCNSTLASVSGSFARYLLAFSGLPHA
jgi:hypothetical protein